MNCISIQVDGLKEKTKDKLKECNILSLQFSN